MSIWGFVLFIIVIIDTFLTGCGVNAGYLKELNPFVAWIIDNAGVFLFIIFKAMFVLLVVAHFDRVLNSGNEKDRRGVKNGYRIVIVFYAAYFVLGWVAVNHVHMVVLPR